MPKLPLSDCCGCTACYNACPKNAIQMSPDGEGFYYPTVNFDRCVECGLCERCCPILHPPKTSSSYADCVVAQSNFTDVLDKFQYKSGRETYYADLEMLGFEKTAKKNVTVKAIDRLIEGLKPLRYYLKRRLKR